MTMNHFTLSCDCNELFCLLVSPGVASAGEQLIAVDSPTNLNSPFYDLEYHGDQELLWIITTERRREIITLQVPYQYCSTVV